MENLIEAKNTIQFLKSHGISAKKRYGQNFLTDRGVLRSIIAGAGINKGDTVLEIGPGIGTLTQALCEHAGHVIAVEIDKDMLPLLEENLSSYSNYDIIHADILKLDIGRTISEKISASDAAGTSGLKIAANLPYYITTPVIMKFLEERLPFKSITVMVQKEVAERMEAQPGGKDYGTLSLAVQYYSKAEIIAVVPGSCFYPSPEVESAVIRLDLYEKPPVAVSDDRRMFAIIKAAFLQRRKKLSNALNSAPGLGISRMEAERALSDMGVRPDIRGERLSLREYAELAERLP